MIWKTKRQKEMENKLAEFEKKQKAVCNYFNLSFVEKNGVPTMEKTDPEAVYINWTKFKFK